MRIPRLAQEAGWKPTARATGFIRFCVPAGRFSTPRLSSYKKETSGCITLDDRNAVEVLVVACKVEALDSLHRREVKPVTGPQMVFNHCPVHQDDIGGEHVENR